MFRPAPAASPPADLTRGSARGGRSRFGHLLPRPRAAPSRPRESSSMDARFCVVPQAAVSSLPTAMDPVNAKRHRDHSRPSRAYGRSAPSLRGDDIRNKREPTAGLTPWLNTVLASERCASVCRRRSLRQRTVARKLTWFARQTCGTNSLRYPTGDRGPNQRADFRFRHGQESRHAFALTPPYESLTGVRPLLRKLARESSG